VLETNSDVLPKSESDLDVSIEDQSQEEYEVSSLVVLYLCLCLTVVIAVFAQAPLPSAMLLFSVSPIVPLLVHLRRIYDWRTVAAPSVMNFGSAAHSGIPAYI
jgi:hypothetical protein